LYDLIFNGKGKMPGENGRLNQDAVWNLVIYVRRLAKGALATASKPPAQ
jgi:hypothetical protein